MQIDLSNPVTLLTILGTVLICSFLAIKFLIDYSHGLQKDLKAEEAKNIDKTFTSIITKFDRDVVELKKDIDGLGGNLRGFRGAMEGFANTIAQVGINHEKINLRVQQIELTLLSLDKKILDIVQFEILKSKNDI